MCLTIGAQFIMTGGSDFFLITDMEFPYLTKFKVRDEFKIEPTEKVLIGGQLFGSLLKNEES